MTDTAADTTSDKEFDQTQPKEPKDVPLPEPTLINLVSSLSAQTMISMGVFPNPVSGKTSILPYQAKHLIDTIALLDEKTKGNQTEEETKIMTHVLHELRMIFVAAQQEQNRRDIEAANEKPDGKDSNKPEEE